MTENNAASRTASEGEFASYVLKWYQGGGPRFCCFLREIKPDRSFYGEITAFSGEAGKQVNITGSLSESDYATFLLLVKEVENYSGRDDSDAPWEGLLAVGSANNPRILFRYRHSADEATDVGRRFLKLVDIFAPYLREFHESVD